MANYFVNPNMADQGAARSEDNFVCGPESLAEIINFIGTTNQATIVLESKNLDETTYTLTTSETVPSNIKLKIWPGAISDGAGTLTLDNPDQILAGNHQLFGSSITVVFTNAGRVYSDWWYDGGTYYSVALQAAIDGLDSGKVKMPGGELLLNTTITIDKGGILLEGTGGIGNSHQANTAMNWGTTLVNKTGNDTAIKIGKDATYISDIVLRDFAIDGDSGTATAGHGIVLDSFGYDPSGVSSVKMYNISIHHVKEYGLYLHGNVFEASLYGCEWRYNEYGIYCDADAGNQSEISFHGCQIWFSTEHGFYRTGSVTDMAFEGCVFGLNKVGMNTAGGMTISGCRFEQNTDLAIDVTGFGTHIMGGLIGTSTTGIDFGTSVAKNSHVYGMFFNGCTTDINIASSAVNVLISGIYSSNDPAVIVNASRSTQFLDANYEILIEAGAARTYGITELNSTAGAMAVTLANGTAIGQQKRFYFISDGGDVTLTVAKHEGSSDVAFTFDTAGNYLVFEWSYVTLGWVTIKNTI